MAATMTTKGKHIRLILNTLEKAVDQQTFSKIYQQLRKMETEYCFSAEGQEPCSEVELAMTRELLSVLENPE